MGKTKKKKSFSESKEAPLKPPDQLDKLKEVIFSNGLLDSEKDILLNSPKEVVEALVDVGAVEFYEAEEVLAASRKRGGVTKALLELLETNGNLSEEDVNYVLDANPPSSSKTPPSDNW